MNTLTEREVDDGKRLVAIDARGRINVAVCDEGEEAVGEVQ